MTARGNALGDAAAKQIQALKGRHKEVHDLDKNKQHESKTPNKNTRQPQR